MEKDSLQKKKYMGILSGCIVLCACLILISDITVSAQDETDEQRTVALVKGSDQGIGFFVAQENDPKLVILLNRYLRSVDATDMYTYYAQILINIVVRDNGIGMKPEFQKKMYEAFEQESAATSVEGKKVLLCKDHPINVQVAKKILEKKGVTVDVAEDGQKGVELFAKSRQGQYAAIRIIF